jgi:hypothetical protein
MILEPLVTQMDELARSTWRRLEESQAQRMPLGENTLTDINLLDLKTLVSKAGLPLRIVPITQNAEARIGADFEFWLRLETGEYFGYSIQAKKVVKGLKHLTYPQLKEPGFPPDRFQYDTLLDHAVSYGTIAVHVFYNGWQLTRAALHQEKPDPGVYGCAAVCTIDMKRLREAGGKRNCNKATRFAEVSMPWSDLFRVPPTGRPRSGGSGGPDVRPPVMPTLESVTTLAQSLIRPDWGDQMPRFDRELPLYVQRALAQPGEQLPDTPEWPRFVVLIGHQGLED